MPLQSWVLQLPALGRLHQTISGNNAHGSCTVNSRHSCAQTLAFWDVRSTENSAITPFLVVFFKSLLAQGIKSRQLQLMQARFNPTIQRTLTQLTQVARPELRLNISLIKLVPVQRIKRYVLLRLTFAFYYILYIIYIIYYILYIISIIYHII